MASAGRADLVARFPSLVEKNRFIVGLRVDFVDSATSYSRMSTS